MSKPKKLVNEWNKFIRLYKDGYFSGDEKVRTSKSIGQALDEITPLVYAAEMSNEDKTAVADEAQAANETMFSDTQYQPNTGAVLDFENEEEKVEYTLVDDGNLLLAKQHTLKPICGNEEVVRDNWVMSMEKGTFAKLYHRAIIAGLIDAPNVARVARGLEMLETAEKVEAMRESGIGIDISQVLIGEFDSIAPPYKWSVIIGKTQKPYSIRARLVDTIITATTQHAATLAAIAAYEEEYGEVVV